MKLLPLAGWRRRFSKFISDYEKVLLALLSVVIVVSGSFWFKQLAGSGDGLPTAGGTYVEGIVGDEVDVQAIAARITKTGLLRVNSEGVLENSIVSSWQANADKTEYVFELLPEIDSQEIVSDLELNSEVLGQAAVTSEGQTIKILLPMANPNIPLVLAQPMFDYGAYKLSKSSDKTTVLTRNNRPGAVEAFINKVVIHNYDSAEQLQEAVTKNRVDGVTLESGSAQLNAPDKFTTQEIALPQYYALIFNQNKSPFKEVEYRRQVISGSGAANKTFSLTVANEEPYLTLGNNLVTAWKAAGLSVELSPAPLDDIQSRIAPGRDFQALLTGISYGLELDPYYLWHSSQIRPPGNNFAGVKSATIDAVLDQIRATTQTVERWNLIDGLHRLLKEEATAVILQQDKRHFSHSENIRFVAPKLTISPLDHWYSLPEWSAR